MEFIKISRTEAADFLEGKLDFDRGFLMLKGYGDDWDNYTGVFPEDNLSEHIREGAYDDFEIWFS